MTSERWAYVVVFALLALFIGYGVLRLADVIPHCPYEDSCYPEYENGEWHIVEGERN